MLIYLLCGQGFKTFQSFIQTKDPTFIDLEKEAF